MSDTLSLRERIAQAISVKALAMPDWTELDPLELADAILPLVEQAIQQARAEEREELRGDIGALVKERDAAEDRQLKRGAQLSELHGALAEKDAQIAAHIRGYARICEVAANNLHRAEVAEAALEAELRDLAADAMTAQSDPHASAAEYRKALIAICNRALARMRETPAPPQEKG